MNTAETLKRLQIELEVALGLCCGQTTEILEHVRTTLGLFLALKGADLETTRCALRGHLGGLTGGYVVEAVYLLWLNNLGLLEHGAGIGASWITERGEATLAKLDRWAQMRDEPRA